MKVFVSLGAQISPDEKTEMFAFFCTVRGTFEIFSNCSTWDSYQDFVDDYDSSNLERYLHLIPERFKK